MIKPKILSISDAKRTDGEVYIHSMKDLKGITL